ncbi:mechanosensitive ion channel family protein [Methylacidimicrobium cyclopophantes]|uniref:mechanosensitive ion channel family protein n=1 Tax=Methylacidimicrobium cyclopophantes TaxID=1041766 RepID=UPI001FE414D2|nr:mechanosensitive ion channel domain-containing protein [Methylacidimicrobium cyclopophantes]
MFSVARMTAVIYARGYYWRQLPLGELSAAFALLALGVLLRGLSKRWHPKPIRWRTPGEPEGWREGILSAIFPPLEAGLLGTAAVMIVLAASNYLRHFTGKGLPRLSIVVGVEAVWSLAFWWFLARFAAVSLHWIQKKTGIGRGEWALLLFPRVARFAYFLVPAIGLIAVESFPLPHFYRLILHKVLAIYTIGLVGLAAGQCVAAVADLLLQRHPMRLPDAAADLRSRKIHTQVRVASRVLYFLIGLVTLSSVLMLFSEVRHLGASLLASAGIVGVIGGLAAQRTIGNIFAGLQIAWTQPVRLGDVVVVEGQWGTIEEITLTYVVVAVWDQIRLVLPISYLIEHPFQNWTRNSSELLGTAHVFVDYTMPVEEMRKYLLEICRKNPLWDGRVAVAQVTHATERTMNVRLLVSAQNSSKLWDLRCAVREEMIAFVRERFPECLPKIRAEWEAVEKSSRSNLLDG